MVVTTAYKVPRLRPLRLVTVKVLPVAAVTIPLPPGVKTTVLVPGVAASKSIPVIVRAMALIGIFAKSGFTVGGAPLNEEFGRAIGADAYCRDAAVAVETAKQFVARKHNQLAG